MGRLGWVGGGAKAPMHAREDNDFVNGLQVETTYQTNLGCMLIRKNKMLTSTAVQKQPVQIQIIPQLIILVNRINLC